MGKRGRKKRARKKNAPNHGKRPNARTEPRIEPACRRRYRRSPGFSVSTVVCVTRVCVTD